MGKLLELKCISCGVNLLSDEDFIMFKCPNCGKIEIARCSKCKRLSNPYVCPNCGFKGP
ncbi:MAG: DUF1610 domain-containing protein [Candidatus Aenigmarchaeota archaeon]|nr:DUF1610 domain-containing protein [Candidatus Aenigmarchaeota archaeon]